MVAIVANTVKITLETPIEYLMFSPRTYNALLREGLHTIGDIVQQAKRDPGLRSVPGVGDKSSDEILSAIHEAGFGSPFMFGY